MRYVLAGVLMLALVPTFTMAQTQSNDDGAAGLRKDIQDLENRKQRLVARMEIIEKLQRKRPEIVHQFDELVRTVPDGVYLTAIKQNGNKLEIRGVAQSSTRVSTFMRNIDSSVWMDNPVLQVVETAKDSPTGGSSFTLFTDTVGVNLEDGGESTVKKVAAK